MKPRDKDLDLFRQALFEAMEREPVIEEVELITAIISGLIET